MNDPQSGRDTRDQGASGMAYPEGNQAVQEEERQDEAEAEQAVAD